MEKKKQISIRYAFASLVIVLGITLTYLNINKEFLGFNSVGSWLIYVGFIMLTVITLQAITNKKRIVDERMHLISYKATRITYLMLIIAAFATMIIDGIKTITVPYHLFASYAIAYLMLIYFISYKILEKYN